MHKFSQGEFVSQINAAQPTVSGGFSVCIGSVSQRGSARQQSRKPRPMPRAMDLGIADADSAKLVLASARICAVLTGT
jgi:hypothetical protein